MTQTGDIITALETAAGKVVKKLTLDVVANLQAPPPLGGTPVDTGWARANWWPNISQPYRADVGSTGSVAGALATSESGKTKVAVSYKLSMGPVFASNNVPYILRLNDGYSKQAPTGFVQRAIAKAVTIDMAGFRP